MMARALAQDLAAIGGARVVVARHPALPPLDLDGVEEVAVRSIGDWRPMMATCDGVWVIAPESGGCLLDLALTAQEAGWHWLGSTAEAIAISTSKRATARVLAGVGIPVLPTSSANADVPPSATGWVAKPDDGVGAQDMIRTESPAILAAWLESGNRRQTHVVQPYLPGAALSACVIAAQGRAALLSVNSQDISLDETGGVYRGGIVGGREDLRPQIEPLVQAVAAAIPGLWGPIGIDLIQGPHGPVVVEINPRLTTAWTGLSRALGRNCIQLVLEVAQGQPLPACRPQSTVSVRVPP